MSSDGKSETTLPMADIWHSNNDDWFVYLPGDSSPWIRGPYRSDLDAAAAFDELRRLEASGVEMPRV